MINSMQAYQLSAALAPSFLANVPAGKEANALGMQFQGAQQGVSVEAYKKAMKDAQPSGLEKALDWGLKGAGLATTAMGIAGGFPGGGGGSGLASAAFNAVPIETTPSTAPTTDMWGQGNADPFGVTSMAQPTAGPQSAPAAAMVEGQAPVVDATSAAKSSDGGGGINMGAVAAAAGGAALLGGAARRGEDIARQQASVDAALKNVSDPRQRGRIMQWAQAGPKEFEAMQPMQRAVAVSGLLEAGIPLTRAQARALPADERRSFQKHYGPDLVPMTGLDKFQSLIDAYEQQTGPGRIVRPYSGLEMYIP